MGAVRAVMSPPRASSAPGAAGLSPEGTRLRGDTPRVPEGSSWGCSRGAAPQPRKESSTKHSPLHPAALPGPYLVIQSSVPLLQGTEEGGSGKVLTPD